MIHTKTEYLIYFVSIPIATTFLIVLATFIILRRSKSVRTTMWAVSFGMFSCAYFFHNLFKMFYMLFIIPVMISCVYSQKRLTLVMGIVSVISKPLIDIILKTVPPIHSLYGLEVATGVLWSLDTLMFVASAVFCTWLCMFIIYVEDKRSTLDRLGRDGLTGLYNRSTSMNIMDKLISKCSHGILILVDLDGFKSVNDKLGHPFGDKVIRESAEVIKNSFRADDCVCRLGGDEFMIYAHEMPLEVVKEKVNKMIA